MCGSICSLGCLCGERWLGEGVSLMLCDVAFDVIVVELVGMGNSDAKRTAPEVKQIATNCVENGNSATVVARLITLVLLLLLAVIIMFNLFLSWFSRNILYFYLLLRVFEMYISAWLASLERDDVDEFCDG